MVFSFLPMLSMFNQNIRRVAGFTYSEQIRLLLSDLSSTNFVPHLAVIGLNIAVFGLLFCILYKKYFQ